MKLHIIIGGTGVGKTSRSVSLALKTGVPVIVIDRIQTYPELATGSGRPNPDELFGTTRLYLTERQVTDGELSADQAYLLLVILLRKLENQHDMVILEGGSISLWKALFSSAELKRHQITIEYLTVANEPMYKQKVKHRIQEMLRPQGQTLSMIEEIEILWNHQEQIDFVRTVVGYKEIIDWCFANNITPKDIDNITNRELTYNHLTQKILDAHINYSKKQYIFFERILNNYQHNNSLIQLTQ
ncbi:isopentenyl-diphosphate delta-isomerase [Nostoc sp. FACHB-152]|uniref:isopentenyl transferase family protein n=1 Tax=unclassified Nostoc TaxID=2593658 RepID=UPI0016886E45|nr:MULTISPECIES: isopentenyl transferase family protein [unclassified Nostoc]MBD2451550.1 isopentenyl-diphosphate delta-isomerase [Nostoc sp. FACHB-152]MBD2466397.1 isopentenyl-diphosphate delta-isomerase [Nostoc sp. FACHB-145]